MGKLHIPAIQGIFIAGLEKLDNDISGKAALNRRKRKKRL